MAVLACWGASASVLAPYPPRVPVSLSAFTVQMIELSAVAWVAYPPRLWSDFAAG